MAVSATFRADFTSFTDAVKKAEVQLRDMESGAGKVGTSLNKMAESFSGKKLISDAQLAAKAIGDIANVSKLTEAEQSKVNRTVTAALEKYKALGQEAPTGLASLADATKKLEPPLSAAQKAAGLLQSAFGQFTLAGLATNAITSLTSSVLAFANLGLKLPAVSQSFTKLSAGLKQNGTEMLANMTTSTQGMVSQLDLMQTANKAILLGLPVTTESMGELSKAATVLGKAMGQDATKSIDDLITALGRSSPMILDNLGLSVKVGEANEAYAKKLGLTADALTDAQKKTAFYDAAMEAARKKTAELGDQTKTLGEIIGSVWTQFGDAVTGAAAIANTGLGAILSSTKNFTRFLSDIPKFGTAVAITMASARAELASMPSAVEEFAAKIRKELEDAAPKASPLEVYRKHLESLKVGVVALTAEQKALVGSALKLGEASSDIAKGMAVSEGVVSAYVKALQDGKAAADAAAKAAAENAAALVPLTDKQRELIKVYEARGLDEQNIAKLVGVNIVKIHQYADELKTLAAITKAMTVSPLTSLPGSTGEDGLNAIKKNIEAQQKALDAAASANDKRTMSSYDFQRTEIDRWVHDEQSKLDKSVAGWMGAFSAIETAGTAKFQALAAVESVAAMKMAVDATKVESAWTDALANIPKLIQAAFTGGGGLGGAGKAITSDLGSTIMGKLFDTKGFVDKIGGPLVDGVGKLFGKGVGNALAVALPGIGSAVGALAGPILSKLENIMFGTKGRDAVKDFAGSLGGFDALHVKLADLGDEGERLWIKLTQGTGRNNPQQAKATIDEITAAWERNKAKVDEAAQAVEAQAGKQSEANQKALDAIKGLNDQIDSLNKSVANEAPEEVMGVIEQQTRAQIDAIVKQRDAAQLALDQTASDAADAAELSAQAIEDTLKAHDFVVKLRFDTGDMPDGYTSMRNLPGFATGGIVPQYLASGGPARGTDTVPAMLTPGEMVLNAGQQKNLADLIGSRDTVSEQRLNALHSGAADDTAAATTAQGKLFRQLDDSLTQANSQLMKLVGTGNTDLIDALTRRNKVADSRLEAIISGLADDTMATTTAQGKLFRDLDDALTVADKSLQAFSGSSGAGPSGPSGTPGAGSNAGAFVQLSNGQWVPKDHPLYLADKFKKVAFDGPGTGILTPNRDKTFGNTGSGGNLDGDTHITLVMPDGDVLLRQFVKSKKRLGIT